MADGTHIQWTDTTSNIITGCTLVDEGCRNCYAAGAQEVNSSRLGMLIRQRREARHG